MTKNLKNQAKEFKGLRAVVLFMYFATGVVLFALLFPIIIVVGYFVAIVGVVTIPALTAAVMFAVVLGHKLMALNPWNSVLQPIEVYEPHLVNIKEYIEDNNYDDDIFLAG